MNALRRRLVTDVLIPLLAAFGIGASLNPVPCAPSSTSPAAIVVTHP